jgi:glutaminyl-tRNA synthetase
MRDGKFKPQEAQLRMKQDILGSGNPQMWDLTAYRVLDAEHHRTGDKWKIYPTYDFTHCLCDSFEDISHSLCTTEFINSRESYDWLCNVLEIYRPQQREYGRLNLTGTIMSKRKIARLVNEGYVRGWDDPRLYTLVAIRRRGVPPGAILSFVNELGVTTAHSFVQIKRFEQTVRRYLEDTVPRLMMITDPVRVVLENLPHDHLEEINLPFKPSDESFGSHAVPFTRILYIDRSDFRETDSSDYFRLAPGKSVGLLKVPHTIRATAFSKNASGEIIEIICHYENDIPFKKPKTYIQWVADCPSKGSPVPLEARVTNQLFKSENPESNPGGFLTDINPDSEQVFSKAIIEVGIHEVQRRAPWPELEGEKNQKHVGPETVRFQALRVGYFALDSDSKEGALVVNRIVTLKEDAGKTA